MKLTREQINQYVVNGGNLMLLTPEQKAVISPESIEERTLIDDRLTDFSADQKKEIPMTKIKEYVAKGGYIADLLPEQRSEVFKDEKVIHQFLANGGELPFTMSKEEEEVLKKVPLKILKQNIANGGYLELLFPEQQKEIFKDEELIKQYVASGRNLDILPTEQKNRILQNADVLEQYVQNGGRLQYLSSDQIKNISSKAVKQYLIKGGDLRYLLPEQVKEIFKAWYLFRDYVRDGARIDTLSLEQIKHINKDTIENIVDGKTISFSPEKGFSVKTPLEVRSLTQKAKDALILYGTRQLEKNDLPPDVYANDVARESLLAMVKVKIKQKYNDICIKNGYVDNVPNEVIAAFDEHLKKVLKQVEVEKQRSIETLRLQGNTSNFNSVMKDIKGMDY